MNCYEATYCADRWFELPNLWVECLGIRLESNLGFPFILDMCRALKAAGHDDGSISFVEKNGKNRYDFPSMYEIADREEALPMLTKQSYQNLLLIDLGDWSQLRKRDRTVLINSGFVTVQQQDDVPTITEVARAAMVAYVNAIYPDITIDNADLGRAADLIGLQMTGPKLYRTLRLIESVIQDRSVMDVNNMAKRAGMLLQAGTSDDMTKRRTLAAIVNAEKLAEVL